MAVLGRSGCGGSEVSGLGEKEDYGGLQTPKTETPIPFERVFDVMKRSDTVKELRRGRQVYHRCCASYYPRTIVLSLAMCPSLPPSLALSLSLFSLPPSLTPSPSTQTGRAEPLSTRTRTGQFLILISLSLFLCLSLSLSLLPLQHELSASGLRPYNSTCQGPFVGFCSGQKPITNESSEPMGKINHQHPEINYSSPYANKSQ